MKTTSNTERLKQIMKNSVGLTDNEGCFADIVQLDVDDYAFLIEQAEASVKLCELYNERGTSMTILSNDSLKLRNEIKRYREVLRTIASSSDPLTAQIARKVLEEFKNENS